MRKFLHQENGFVEHEKWLPYCWVNIECPDHDDVSFLLDDLSIPMDFLESIADIDENPRVEKDGDWKLTILRIPLKVKKGSIPYVTVPIGIITNCEILVTVCYHRTELISDFIDHTRAKGITIDNAEDFILRIMHSASYWYLRYLREINHTVTDSEAQLEKSIRNEDLLILQHLQKTLVYFTTSIRGNEDLMVRLTHVYGNEFDNDLKEDVEIEFRQADTTSTIYSDILNNILDAFASVISNNVNDIMKKMTGVSFVLMIPTLIASFYGMNVAISYGNSPWALYIIVAASLLLSVALYIIMRKAKWL